MGGGSLLRRRIDQRDVARRRLAGGGPAAVQEGLARLQHPAAALPSHRPERNSRVRCKRASHPTVRGSRVRGRSNRGSSRNNFQTRVC